MHTGAATSEGTRRFAEQRTGTHAEFYRKAQDLTVSSIGIGTYLGEMNAAADASYVEAVQEAVRLGVNLIDTSLNYRHERSEKNIGEALRSLTRDELVVCTKAGFLVPGAVPVGGISPDDVAGGMHCMAPAFLQDQLERSLLNLGVDAVDVFYLHNPETQIRFVGRELFEGRLRAAFEMLESLADGGRFRFYGAATWEGFRKKGQLSIVTLERLARDVAGERHRFRFVQLPLNLGMPEAIASEHETLEGKHVTPIKAAESLGITVVASATLMQARLASGLPDALASHFKGATTDAQRAIQFTRSTGGITTALVGMGSAAHVRENLALRNVPPLDPVDYAALWRSTH